MNPRRDLALLLPIWRTTTLRRLTLTEYKVQSAVALTPAERDGLRRLNPGLRIEPTMGSEGLYELTAHHHIGVVALPSLVLEIRPKVPMSSVLFLVSYACDIASWFDQQPELAKDLDVVEMLAIMLARLVEHATRRGLLNGYQTEEEGLQAPRGRILFDEQIRRRMGAAPPVEVRHDVFTADIIENRLLLAGLTAMGRLPLRSDSTRRELARAGRLLGAVSSVYFSPAIVPDVIFTRLNRHYQPAVALATLLLRSASLDVGAGGARGSAFLIDMNKVFERFVRKALRTALKAGDRILPERPPRVTLDEAGRIPLKPDLCVLRDTRIVWVGDAKYKRLPAGAYQNADLYQLLAYAVTLGLSGGVLIYAADAGVIAAEHVVVKAGKRLGVVALDLSARPARIIQQVGAIAERVESLLTGDRAGYNEANEQATPALRS